MLAWPVGPRNLAANDPPDETELTGMAGEDTAPSVSDDLLLGPLRLSGEVSQKYRFRDNPAGRDQDVYGYLSFDARYPGATDDGEKAYREIGFNLQASYNLDIDGFQRAGDASQGSSFFPFLDSSNTFPDRFQSYLHSAYLEIDDVAAFDSLRLGRQFIWREEGILFDGGYLRTKPWKTFALDLYGGLPAHLYETSASGDAFGGAGVETHPLPGLTVGADYFYIRDQRKDLEDADEHLYLVRGSYRIDEEWSVRGSASWVDTRDRLQQLDVSYQSADCGLLAQIRVKRQNAVVDFQTSELSPYVFIAGSYAPYWQYMLDLDQPLGEKFAIGGGAHLRHLEDSSDEGLYNHDFRNLYLAVDATDLWEGSRMSLRGDLWDSDEDDIYSVGLELEQRVFDFLRARVGTSYALYRIDLFTGKERERDRIYYARLRWHLTPRLDLDTDYQYERDSVSEYHTVTTGLRLCF